MSDKDKCQEGELWDGSPILTVSGVVMFNGGFMHPFTYRDFCGEEAYKELLAGPRIRCEYDD